MTDSPIPPTIVEPISQAEFTARLHEEMPNPWTSDQAKAAGGILNAVFEGIANQEELIQTNLVYGFKASRITTAIDEALDRCAQDFYGNTLPRQGGEPDESYRARIKGGFFKPKVTRPAIIALLEELTGLAPSLFEPWNVANTGGAWDWYKSGWDADTPTNPCRWGSPELRYQGFAEVQLPHVTPLQQSGLIYGWDAGSGWDMQTGTWWTVTNGIFLSHNILDSIITNAKAFGITVYRKYFQSLVSVRMVYRLAVASASTGFSSDVKIGPYVLYANAGWNANVALARRDGSEYELVYSSPPPTGKFIQLAITPITSNGASIIGVTAATTALVMTRPAGFEGTPMIMPSWNTTVWITDDDGTDYTVNFGTAAPSAAFIDVQYAPLNLSGVVALQENQQNVALPVSNLPNHVVVAVPTYNTTCAIVIGSDVSVDLNVIVPDANQRLYYAVVPIGNP